MISSMGWREGRREREENIFSKERITTTQDLGWRAHWGVAGQRTHWGVAGNLLTGWGLFIKRWRYGDKELRS